MAGSISIRVYILAMIPAGHPEIYRRGTMRIDILFSIPQPFHVLLGEGNPDERTVKLGR